MDEECADRCFATDPGCLACLEAGGDCGYGDPSSPGTPGAPGGTDTACAAQEAAIESCIGTSGCMDDACIEMRCATQIAAAEACWSASGGSDPGAPGTPGTPPSGGSCDAVDAAVETCIETNGCTNDECVFTRCAMQIEASDACWAAAGGGGDPGSPGGSDPGSPGGGGDCTSQESALDACIESNRCSDDACVEMRCAMQLDALYACYDAGGGGWDDGGGGGW